MSKDYTIATEIKNTIAYIGETFVDPNNSTPYLGQGLKNVNIGAKSDSELNFVEAIVKGYDSFKARFASSLPTSATADTISKIMMKNLDGNEYKVLAEDTFSPTNTEINFSKVLNTNGDLLNILNKIKNTYTFLQDETLKKYSSGVPFMVSNYALDENNHSHMMVDNAGKTQFLAKINAVVGDMSKFDYIKNDVFIIRRLMLLYELMANIYISMHLLDIAVENGVTDQEVISSLSWIISNTGSILINLNKNFIFTSDETVPARSKIVNTMNQKAQEVRASSDQINALDDQVRNLKMALANNKNLYSSGRHNSGKAMLYEKVVLGIFIASLVVIIAISWAPIEKSTKLLVDSVVLVVLIVSAYIVDYLYRTKIEGFVGGAGLPGGTKQLNVGITRDQKNTLMASSNNTYQNEAENFLSVSIYLGLMLQSGRTYSGIDASMKREISYFTQMARLVENTNDKVANAAALTRMDAMTSAARITFFVSLGIVLGGTIIAYIMVEENIKYQPYIIGVAGLLILLVAVRYVFEISRRVRNDASKFYWNKPSGISKLD